MKRRLVPFFLLLGMFGLQTIAAPSADGQRRKPPRRTVVVVHRGFPIKRAPRNVVIHAIRRPYRIAPRLYLPLLTWGGVLVTTIPGRDLMVWEDGETLIQDEEWTEFTLNCENTGTKLWLEVVSGKAGSIGPKWFSATGRPRRSRCRNSSAIRATTSFSILPRAAKSTMCEWWPKLNLPRLGLS
jgi:hypothetical protein